ncbi:MAG TPA: hypothetical protein PKA66_07340 [Gemmatimonadales bacterium]|nr:hypothetical protein [Gemmatimonadales bacterium]
MWLERREIFVLRGVPLRLRGMHGRLILAGRLLRWNLRRAVATLRQLFTSKGSTP